MTPNDPLRRIFFFFFLWFACILYDIVLEKDPARWHPRRLLQRRRSQWLLLSVCQTGIYGLMRWMPRSLSFKLSWPTPSLRSRWKLALSDVPKSSTSIVHGSSGSKIVQAIFVWAAVDQPCCSNISDIMFYLFARGFCCRSETEYESSTRTFWMDGRSTRGYGRRRRRVVRCR